MSTRRLLALTCLLAALVASAAGQGIADEATEAFDSVSACLQERDRLLVLALVDESGSLRRTDPDSTRSTALETVARNLASVAQVGSSDAPAVEMKISTFASDVGDMTGWVSLDESTLPEVVRASRDLAQRDRGLDTDFLTALVGARDLLDERTAELAGEGVTACPTLLWFTDGDYDLEPRSRTVWYAPDLPLDRPGNPEQAMEIGKQLICEPSGVMDDLHGAGVITLIVGLGLEITAENEQLLHQMSEGSGECGSVERPGSGAYLSAADLNQLLFAFDRASTGLLGGTVAAEDEVVPCPRESCPSGSRTFELDPSLDRFHLLVTAPEPVRVELSGPSGRPVDLQRSEPGGEVVDGASLRWTPLAGAFLIDGELESAQAADWVGTWTVTFIDPTGEAHDTLGRSQIVLFGALTPQFAAAEPARLGESGEVVVDIIDAAGTPRTPADLVGRTRLDITVTDPVSGNNLPVEVGQPDANGRRAARFEVAPGITSSSLQAVARLTVTTVGGVELPERRDTTTISLLPPASYPRIEPAALRIGPVASGETGLALVRLIGGEDDGCVWFGPSSLGGHRDLGEVSLSLAGGHVDPGSCVSVPAGETVTVDVEVLHDTSAGGLAEGSLPVLLASDAGGEVITQELPVTVEFVRVVDSGLRLAMFLMVFLVGLGLPLLFLYLVNLATARFRDPAFVRAAAIPVEVHIDRIARHADGATAQDLTIRPEEFRAIGAPAGDLKEVLLPGLRLHRRVPLWPLSTPSGVATADGTSTTIAAGGSRRSGGRSVGVLSLALPLQWVLAIDDFRWSEDEEEPRVHGRLWVFINEGTPYPLIQDAVEVRLAREVPPAVAALPPSPRPSTDGEPEVAGEGPAWRPPADTPPTGSWAPPTDHVDRPVTFAPSGSSPATSDSGVGNPAAEPHAWSPPRDDDPLSQAAPPPGEFGTAARRQPDDGLTWRPPDDRSRKRRKAPNEG
jgi:hypothetical protein